MIDILQRMRKVVSNSKTHPISAIYIHYCVPATDGRRWAFKRFFDFDSLFPFLLEKSLTCKVDGIDLDLGDTINIKWRALDITLDESSDFGTNIDADWLELFDKLKWDEEWRNRNRIRYNGG